MSYLGNTPTTQNFISGTDYFNGTGAQTAFTLSRTVNSVNDIQVTVNNVVQQPNDAYTLSGTTLTMTSAPSAGTNNVYVRYLSTTTQVITPSQNTVSWNTLDTNTQNDLGLMYKNKIINGNMVIAQRGTAAVTTNGAFPVDRWVQFMSGGGVISGVQDSDVPNSSFQFSTRLTVSTPDSSIAASDFYAFNQSIEGFNAADLGFGTAAAKTVTLSFWVRSSITGTYAVALYNSNGTRGYPATYTISAANTWTFVSLTIPGDTGGTWLKDNGIGITIRYDLGTGSNGNGTANTWNTSGTFAASRTSSTVNWISTNGATFYLTGVQLEVGTQATAFSTAGGSYGAELALCQRYLPAWTAPGSAEGLIAAGGCANTTVGAFTVIYPVTTRVPPTGVSVTNATHFSTWFTTSVGVGTGISFAGRATTQACQINLTTSGLTTGAAASLGFNSNATSSSVLLLTGCEL